ncbi:MAG: hypothetical protein SVX38_12545 [Chloroflexota bacterium]|nr:hypothetical protein [Chloroflexota bacterium]
MMKKSWEVSHTAPLALLLALIGYWGPWVDHQSTALVLNGLDMSEFVKFLPEVRSGSAFMLRELFYLPPLAAALCLALLAVRLRSHPAIVRMVMFGLAVGLCIVVLPPYPFVLHALASAEFRRQFILAVFSLGLVAASPLYRRLPARLVSLILVALAFVGVIPAVAQFFAIRPALDQAYGWPVQIGWGLWVTVVGFAFVIVTAGSESTAEA